MIESYMIAYLSTGTATNLTKTIVAYLIHFGFFNLSAFSQNYACFVATIWRQFSTIRGRSVHVLHVSKREK